MSEVPYNPELVNSPFRERGFHTGKNFHETAGSRTARTTQFKVGELAQVDNKNHESHTDHGVLLCDPTAGLNNEIVVIDSFPIETDVNKKVDGSATDYRGGPMNFVRGRGRRCKALVRAVGADITVGTFLQPNNATGYRSLRNSASTAITNVLSRVVTGGAGRSYAVACGAATVAETTTAGVDKLIDIEILSD
jgi:hypothetical protein